MSKIVMPHGAKFGSGHDQPGGFGARRHFPEIAPRPHGPPRGATYGANIGVALDAPAVVYRLEEAGATLLRLPNTGHSTRLRTSSFEVMAGALDWMRPTCRRRPTPPACARRRPTARASTAWTRPGPGSA